MNYTLFGDEQIDDMDHCKLSLNLRRLRYNFLHKVVCLVLPRCFNRWNTVDRTRIDDRKWDANERMKDTERVSDWKVVLRLVWPRNFSVCEPVNVDSYAWLNKIHFNSFSTRMTCIYTDRCRAAGVSPESTSDLNVIMPAIGMLEIPPWVRSRRFALALRVAKRELKYTVGLKNFSWLNLRRESRNLTFIQAKINR